MNNFLVLFEELDALFIRSGELGKHISLFIWTVSVLSLLHLIDYY